TTAPLLVTFATTVPEPPRTPPVRRTGLPRVFSTPASASEASPPDCVYPPDVARVWPEETVTVPALVTGPVVRVPVTTLRVPVAVLLTGTDSWAVPVNVLRVRPALMNCGPAAGAATT